ncbi:MAG: lamin tail domain-containing protein, partial [Verrucomicrobia bacterium]|nr:lamin tail domain-containing protein [Verrucomicrobiota bacterium]
INDVDHPLTWISGTEWQVLVPLQAGNNRLNIAGLDGAGTVVPGALRTVSVRFTGQLERPEDRLVFTEIQYRPPVPDAAYVELLNASTHNTFNVSGWRVEGLGYTFPAGTFLAPGVRWVITADPGAFASAYPWSLVPPDDVFSGTLSPTGETLRLIRPGTVPEPDSVVTAVTYLPDAPWPPVANGGGAALQLVDPDRSEDERAGNWSAVPPRDPNAGEWRFATATGTAGSDGTLQLYLSSFPPVTDPGDIAGVFWGAITFGGDPFPCGIRVQRESAAISVQFLFDPSNPANSTPMNAVSWDGATLRFEFDPSNRFTGRLAPGGFEVTGTYVAGNTRAPFTFARLNPGGEIFLDDLQLVAGASLEAGPNLLVNAGFEEPLAGSWTAAGDHAASERVTDISRSGGAALRVRSETGGTGSAANSVTQPVAGLTPGTPVTLGYWYLGTTNGSGFMVRLGTDGVAAAVSVAPPPDPHLETTPGFLNATDARLAPFPHLWINEVLPDPLGGEPFAELFNAGTNVLLLDGFHLSDRIEEPLRDALPAGLSIPPGGFLRIILDGSGRLEDPTGPRTSFRPATSNGLLLLSRPSGGRVVLVDYLRWTTPARGRSFGHYPDGSPHDDREFATPTPGAPNSLAVPRSPVVINEWMALNTRIPDPAGGPDSSEFDDWFELFNPNAQPVELDGHVLSNSLDDRTKFRIPSGYAIPGRGFLLVWADNQSRQNQAGDPNLHVNFRLSGGGEAIALFAPDGTLVDAVTFGPQQQNVSEGRPTDGGAGAPVRLATPSPGSPNATRPPPAVPLLFLPVVRGDGAVELRWRTEPDRSYQARWKESLQAPWQLLGSRVRAVADQLSTVDAQPGTAARFYDILVVE